MDRYYVVELRLDALEAAASTMPQPSPTTLWTKNLVFGSAEYQQYRKQRMLYYLQRCVHEAAVEAVVYGATVKSAIGWQTGAEGGASVN